MKTLSLLVGALLAAGAIAWVGSGEASSGAVRKLTICHKTSSKTRPYQRITVAGAKAIAGHQAHADDIIPAPTTCPQTLLTATSGGTAFTVNLRGVSEQPEPADPDGAGTATLRLRAGQKRVCFTLNASNITLPAAGAHIHRGNVDQSGDIVVQLSAPGTTGSSTGCAVAVRSLVSEILSSPTSFYVNVHTTDFPAGAIRAQLAMPTTAKLLTASMNGANEKPSAGDPDGAGASAVLVFPSTGRVCYTIAVSNITLPTIGSHIHKGSPDVAGPVVVPFLAVGVNGSTAGCANADVALVADIAANPSSYYTNVHTREHPGGAVRGTLAVAP